MFLLSFHKIIKMYIDEYTKEISTKERCPNYNKFREIKNNNILDQYDEKEKLLNVIRIFEKDKSDYLDSYLIYFNLKIRYLFK